MEYKKCVLCGHEGDTNPRGICQTEGCFGGEEWRTCGCKCDFTDTEGDSHKMKQECFTVAEALDWGLVNGDNHN